MKADQASAGPSIRRGKVIGRSRVQALVSAIAISIFFVLLWPKYRRDPRTYALCSPNGQFIYTVDEDQPTVQCILVDKTRIVKVGSLGWSSTAPLAHKSFEQHEQRTFHLNSFPHSHGDHHQSSTSHPAPSWCLALQVSIPDLCIISLSLLTMDQTLMPTSSNMGKVANSKYRTPTHSRSCWKSSRPTSLHAPT